VKRSEATRRIDGLLERVVSGEGRYLPRVCEVRIFGSYARGALEVGDVDLAVEFDQTKDEAGLWFATLMAGGFDYLGALRRELRGNQRALEIHFNELDELRKEGFEPQLLWRRGDSLEEARARLAALAPDARAQRAARGRAGSTPGSSSCRRSRRRTLQRATASPSGGPSPTRVSVRRTLSRATSNEKESHRSERVEPFTPTSGRFSTRSATTGSRASQSTSEPSCSSGRCSTSAKEHRACSSS
jgi:predicted nucleotidyltransferase